MASAMQLKVTVSACTAWLISVKAFTQGEEPRTSTSPDISPREPWAPGASLNRRVQRDFCGPQASSWHLRDDAQGMSPPLCSGAAVGASVALEPSHEGDVSEGHTTTASARRNRSASNHEDLAMLCKAYRPNPSISCCSKSTFLAISSSRLTHS